MSTNEAGNSLFVKSNTKYGEKTVEIVPAVAFLLLSFLWRSKEKKVPAPA
ncbi:hypothetical protein [Eikenella corrodens]|nr:hypothetical protein [Eikenella corrodens]